MIECSLVVQWLGGFPGGASGKEPVCNRRWKRHMFDPWLEDPLEEGMASHPSILAWRIPWTEEPGALWSIGSQRVGHDWNDWAHTCMPTQWLGLCSFTAVALGSILGWETKILKAIWGAPPKKKKKQTTNDKNCLREIGGNATGKADENYRFRPAPPRSIITHMFMSE